MAGAFFELAEGVDEAGVEQGGEVVALLVGEAGAAVVGLGVGDVELGVGDVEIAAADDGFAAGFEALEVREERGVPLAGAVVEAREAALRVGLVEVDEEKLGELGGDHAAFAVVLGEAEAEGDVERLLAGEDDGAAVAFFLGAVPVGRVAGGPLDVLDVAGVRFGFLEADDVGSGGGHVVEEAFLQGGADAIHVPGDEFHARGVGWKNEGRQERRCAAGRPVQKSAGEVYFNSSRIVGSMTSAQRR